MHIGKPVWYFPSPYDESIVLHCDSRPCVASVLRLRDDGRADLVVIDHEGRQHERRAIYVAAEVSEIPPRETDCCVIDWVPERSRELAVA